MNIQSMMGIFRRTNHPPIKVLHPTLLGNVACDAEVEEDVVKRGVPVWLQTTEHDEPPTVVDNIRGLKEPVPQVRERKSLGSNVIWAEAV